MKKTLYSIITTTILSLGSFGLGSLGTAQSITVNFPELYSKKINRVIQPVLEQKGLENYLDGSFENGEAIQLNIKEKNGNYVLTLNAITKEEYKNFKRNNYTNGITTNSTIPKSISLKLDYTTGNKILQVLFEEALNSKTIQDAYDYLQLQIKALEGKLQEYSNMIEENNKNTIINLTTLRELTSQIKKVYDNINLLKQTQTEYENKIKSLEEKTNSIERINNRLLEENNRLKSDLTLKTESLEEKTTSNDSMINYYNTRIIRLQDELSGTEYSLKTLQEKYKSLEEQIKQLREDFNEEKLERLQQKMITNKSLEEEMERLEEEMRYYKIGTIALSGIAVILSLLAFTRKK